MGHDCLKFERVLLVRLSAFDFYTAKSGRDEEVSEAKISSKILRRKPVNTTRNEHGGVEIYKNL